MQKNILMQNHIYMKISVSVWFIFKIFLGIPSYWNLEKCLIIFWAF